MPAGRHSILIIRYILSKIRKFALLRRIWAN
jgi:hypothetical protein